MSSAQRRVTIGAGQVLLVRKMATPSSRPGFARVTHRSRGPLEISERAWAEGSPA